VTRPPKQVLVDPQRLKLTKREQVDDNIQLGPGGRGMTPWQFGSRGGGKVGAAGSAAPDNEKQQMNRQLIFFQHLSLTGLVSTFKSYRFSYTVIFMSASIQFHCSIQMAAV
jgi:hypothetical protein